HVLRTRAPCAIPYCYGTRTRLACVKHAASVRSEPGSNSRLKPVAWAKKMPWISPRSAYPSKLLIRSILLKAIRARRMVFERILAHRIDCQRATAPLSSRVATKQPDEYRKAPPECQHPIPPIFSFSTALHSPTNVRKPKTRRGATTLPAPGVWVWQDLERQLQPPLEHARRSQAEYARSYSYALSALLRIRGSVQRSRLAVQDAANHRLRQVEVGEV